MSLRYLGGYVSPSYNPLAANVGPGVNVAQTQGVYTTQAALESLSAGQWCTDPDFNKTTLLLQADGTANASQNNTFLDSSANNFTITRSGNPTQGSLSPFSSQPGYWSGYFGGTGYYATTPFQSLPTTTSTFTIEAWIFQTAYPVAQGGPVQPSLVGDQNPTGAGANWMFGVLSTGLLSFWWNDTGVKACVGNTVTPLNTWVHVAVSVSANAIKLFVNGQLQTLTGNTTLGNRGSDQGRTTIGQYAGTNSYIYGYVSNLRIVTGTALYSTSFTPSTTPLTAISGTTFLTLQNNTTFKDASTNNRTITPTLASGQPFSPAAPQYAYSSAITTNSVLFDATGDSLVFPNSSNFSFGTNAYTVEFWVYFPSYAGGNNRIIDLGASTNSWGVQINNTGTISITKFGAADVFTSPTGFVLNSWNHVAVVRSSTSTNGTKIYLNGVVLGTTTDNNTWAVGTTPKINDISVSLAFSGYLSNVRIVNGTAIYTANFTPSTIPLTVVPNTQLLTCQATTFIDSSPNNFTITVNGNSVVQAFSPFAPYFSMGPNVTGGSGYFDGDNLNIPSSDNLSPGTIFTFETWVYFTSAPNGYVFYEISGTSSFQCGFNGTTEWGVASRATAWRLTTTTLPINNQWNHIVVSRGGTGTNQASLFLNGVRVANGTITDAFTTAGSLTIGVSCVGYLSNMRLVKGTDVYGYTNTTITVPTAPLTAITNTQFLTNYTNAGIVDNSLKTVAETVGNAKVSTSVKKYGSGSMAFDGTGDWLFLPDSPALQMGLGDFTVEGWVYLTATGTARGLVSKGTSTTGWSIYITSTNVLQATYSATTITGTVPLVANTWYHFAMVRFSSSVGNIKIYLNGALAASSATAITTDFIQTNPLYVGANRVAGEPMLGYMDDVRITKMARYKDSFIPPTIAFARQ